MPGLWLERSAAATVRGQGLRFSPRVAALPFSTPTPKGGLTAPLVDAGRGAEADFTRLGAAAKGAIVLVETEELQNLDGLFREYNEAVGIERRAIAAGAAGLVYMVDATVQVKVVLRDDLPNTAAGKFRWVVNEWQDGRRI